MNGAYQIKLTFAALQNLIHAYSAVPVMLLDEGGRLVEANAKLLHTVGTSLEALQGQECRARLGEDELPVTLVYEQWFQGSEAPSALPEIEIHGAQEPVRSRSYAIYHAVTEDGAYYGVVIEDLREVRELTLLQRFAGSLLRDVNLGVILVDPQFRLVDISDMGCKILGFERSKVLNRPMEELFAAVPNEHQLVQRTILDGVVIRNHAISWTNDQERYELLMDSNLLRDERGNLVGAYLMFKDVTNLRSLEEQVQRSDRLAMIGQIAAGTAHEIRNPLTSIRGFLQMFQKTFVELGMEKERAYTDIMLTEINRINELVNEFLLLSKPKHASMEAVDISGVLRDILPIINNEAILHDVSVQYQSAYRLPRVVADRELLKQVFLNISKNGIEAMGEGGKLVITERCNTEERKVHVDIHDTGPGIPVFLIDKIFDPFFTTKDNGTGLGLSVCQRIIHDIGGTIRVSSKGYGTTFTVSIPFTEA